MNKDITLEQALSNLEAACANFVGTKNQHIALDQSLVIVKQKLGLIPQPENVEENEQK